MTKQVLTNERQREITNAVRALYEAEDADSVLDDQVIAYVTDSSWYESCGTAPDGRNAHQVWLETAPAEDIAEWIDIDELA